MDRTRTFTAAATALLAMTLTADNAAANAPSPLQSQQPSEVPGFDVIDAAYAGTGCPGFPLSTATVVLSPDQSRLSVLFDQYIARTFQERLVSRKICNVVISLSVPSGYHIALSRIVFQGCADIPPGGYGRLLAEYFFAGQQGLRICEFGPGQRVDLCEIRLPEPIWSECGADLLVRANTSLLAVKPEGSVHEASLSLGSAPDVYEGITFYLRSGTCLP